MRFKGKTIFAAVAAAVLLAMLLPATAFAANDQTVSFKRSGVSSVAPGETLYVTFSTTPSTSDGYKLVLEPVDSDLVVTSGNNASYSGSGPNSTTFGIRAVAGASPGFHGLTLKAVDPSAPTREYSHHYWEIEVLESGGSQSHMDRSALDISYDVDGGDQFSAGNVETLRLYFLNRGNVDLTDARVKITLPEGLTLQSGATTANLGYINSGKTKTAEFSVSSSSDIVTGSYPITLELTGNSAGEEFTQSETFYVPVSGKDAVSEAMDLSITNINIPAQVNERQDFKLTFSVHNNGTQPANKVRVSVTMPTGAVNTSKNVFSVDSIAPGASADFSVDLKVASAPADGEYQLFEITAGPASDPESSISQFAGTLATGTASSVGDDENRSQPILMVSGYTYGGDTVNAGSEFPLSLTFYNTSNAALRNIKVTLESASGTFIPVGSSSSIYIPSIAAGASVSRSLNMSCRLDVEQGPSAITVGMSYEDASAGKYTATDVISVPVTQETRLVIDDILDPGYLTMGDTAYANVNFYNMGRNQINNLRVSVEGDFTVDGTPSAYIGNLDSGRDDYYAFSFFPNAEGPCNGTVTFTYEDANGTEQTIEKSFTFNINPPYNMEEEPPMMEEPVETGLSTGAKIGIGVGAAAVLIAIVIILKRRKAKKQEALELDD